MTYQKPKGTVDQYPEEKEVLNKLFGLFREQAAKYGFKEIESPAFESFELLSKKEGEEIREQIFTLTKRKGEDLGLRFDLTVPAARMFIAKQKSLPKPVKWFLCTRMWRYERPQTGRLREFYQFGTEIFGSDKPETDAEVISLAIDSLKATGLTNKDFVVYINNRKLLQGILLNFIEEDKFEEAIKIIDKKEKIEEKEFKQFLKEVGIIDVPRFMKILELNDIEMIEKLDKNALATEGFNELKKAYELLDKKYVKIDISTARGLAYYTGTVFEIFDIKGKYRALCGGGRYDKMVEMFGGIPTPATGFGIGMSTLKLLLEEKKLLPKIDLGVDYYIAPVGETMIKKALDIAAILRKKASVDVDLMQRNLAKQFAYASSINAKNVVIVGETDLNQKKVTVRDMKTGKERKVDVSKL